MLMGLACVLFPLPLKNMDPGLGSFLHPPTPMHTQTKQVPIPEDRGDSGFSAPSLLEPELPFLDMS